MKALALDLSSKCGWAVWDGKSPRPTLGQKAILHWHRDEGFMLESFRTWIGRMLEEHQPEVVAIEAPTMGAHGDMVTIYKQAMLHGLAAWACYVMQIRRFAIPAPTWRKSFIGFGTRGKRVKVDWKGLAVARCKALDIDVPRLPSGAPDHNCAEAFGVLDNLLFVQLGIVPPWRGDEHADSWLPLPEIDHGNR